LDVNGDIRAHNLTLAITWSLSLGKIQLSIAGSSSYNTWDICNIEWTIIYKWSSFYGCNWSSRVRLDN
jgi:hypothetical protein